MDRAINAPGHGKNVVDWLNETDKRDLKGKLNLLVNYDVNIPKRLDWFPVLQNTSPKHVYINVYKFSIIKKYEIDSKVAQKWKIDNHYSDINNLYTIFKINLMLITEVLKWDETTNFPHH